MTPKPDSCQDCPFYGDGQGFVHDECPQDAHVLFVAQNPGESEEVQSRPLIGVTGQMFRTRFVARHLPGLRVGYANIVKCRMQQSGRRSNNLPPLGSALWRQVVTKCRPFLDETLQKCPEALIVPMGEHSALAMTGMKAKAMLHLRGTFIPEES